MLSVYVGLLASLGVCFEHVCWVACLLGLDAFVFGLGWVGYLNLTGVVALLWGGFGA